MKLCPFCHSWVSENIWDSHLDSHTRLLPDGQMQDHITLRPEERFQEASTRSRNGTFTPNAAR